MTKSYGQGEPVLKGLDLKVEGSGITAIIGSSGAGKSTLLRCINRLIEPDSGTVLLNGTDLTRLKGAALRNARRSIGMIFQSFKLLDRLTVIENVLAGRLEIGRASCRAGESGGGDARAARQHTERSRTDRAYDE